MIERGAYTDLESLVQQQYDAIGFSFLPRYAVTSLLSGKHRSKLRGRGLDFEEVRAYQFGDDIRNIDWKVTARTRKTHTKVFTEERERPVLVVVDQSTSMFFGSVSATKSVAAAELAALAAWRTLAQGDRIGGIVASEDALKTVRPQRSRNAVLHFLQNLVDFNRNLPLEHDSESPNVPIVQALAEAERIATHDYLILVISSLGQVDDRVIRSLIRLKQHNDVVLGLAFDEMERVLPESELVLSDGANQVALDESDSTIRSDFTAHFTSRMTSLVDQLRGYGVPIFSFDTERPVAGQLRDAIGRR
jgi:uncharacterized protein (DUF58 family)